MIREGFPEDRLIAFCHPYLSDIFERYAALYADAVVSALEIASSGIRLEETLIFVSEPLLNCEQSPGTSTPLTRQVGCGGALLELLLN